MTLVQNDAWHLYQLFLERMTKRKFLCPMSSLNEPWTDVKNSQRK